MKSIIWGLITITSFSIYGQSNSPLIPIELQKCYAEVFVEDQYEKSEMTLFLFTGEETNNVDLDTLYFKVEEETNQLVYVGRIEDLNISEIDENAKDIEKFIFVQDTSETQEIVEETFEYEELIQKNGYTKWIEVLCDLGEEYLIELQEALEKEGYLSTPFESKIGIKTQEALKMYQKDNNLPVGYFDLKTMKALEISIKY